MKECLSDKAMPARRDLLENVVGRKAEARLETVRLFEIMPPELQRTINGSQGNDPRAVICCYCTPINIAISFHQTCGLCLDKAED